MDTLAFTTYQLAAARTDRLDAPKRERIANHALGLAGETGELVDLLKKHLFHGHALDRARVRDELGDVLWYVARIAADFDLDLGECARANVEKLRRRYPDGFSAAASVARVDAREGAGRANGAGQVSEAGLASIVAPAGSEGHQEGRG